jgi:tRNA pseudouridine55 synthase
VDGVLIIDKPSGMTSHDVVAIVRRTLGERRIGHTGTLDPLATGVLPLACGRATRLARFFSASDKDYDATIRFGLATDSYDVTGTAVQETGRMPALADIEQALASLRGRYLQTPPPYSAKKIGGTRAYTLARRQESVELTPVPVDVTKADVTAHDEFHVTVAITCTAGFYVRTLAHTLGQLVGTGACLAALRRTRSGRFSLDGAMPIGSGTDLLAALVPIDDLLPEMRAVYLTETGRWRVAHGQALLPAHYAAGHGEAPREASLAAVAGPVTSNEADWTRLVDPGGALIGLARPGQEPGALHPSIVLI